MNPFNKIGKVKIKHSLFDLSHEVKFTGDMGFLYPILCEDCIPGDFWSINNEVIIRFYQPLLAPILHEVNVHVHYFFVPYRILWHDGKLWPGHDVHVPLQGYDCTGNSWETFITGGPKGDDKDIFGVTCILPKSKHFEVASNAENKQRGSLLDFLYGVSRIGTIQTTSPDGVGKPVAFPEITYARIWNEYYRDQELQDEVETAKQVPGYIVGTQSKNYIDGDKYLFHRNWERDYFTSSRPDTQRGQAPALPPSGIINSQTIFDGNDNQGFPIMPVNVLNNWKTEIIRPSGVNSDQVNMANTWTDPDTGYIFATNGGQMKDWLNQNHMALNASHLFNINDLRTAVQLQKYLERNERAGIRYKEWLIAHFSVDNQDSRLDRPEYLGGTKAPVIFSEVLKTASEGEEGDPQGHLAGHGISASRGHAARYRVKEHGIIMGLLSVMPRTAYQQGVDRLWLKNSKYDYPTPEFFHLSEWPIFQQEIMCWAETTNVNQEIFGYQGRYDEYRYRKNQIHGELRGDIVDEPGIESGSLSFWTITRYFQRNSSNRPRLNSNFIMCRPSKRIYPSTDDPGMIIQVGNKVRAIRPMPFTPEPGLMDHF